MLTVEGDEDNERTRNRPPSANNSRDQDGGGGPGGLGIGGGGAGGFGRGGLSFMIWNHCIPLYLHEQLNQGIRVIRRRDVALTRVIVLICSP